MRDVLQKLHRHVLGAHEAGLEHGKARRHPEHEDAAEQHQEAVEDELDLYRGRLRQLGGRFDGLFGGLLREGRQRHDRR